MVMMRNKYNNKKTEYKGELYDSKAEARFAMKLDVLKSATDPKERVLKVDRQVPYQIEVNGIKICKYMADFVVSYAHGDVVYDVKGVKTDAYRLKKKLVEAQFGIKIVEITKKSNGSKN